MDKNKLLLALVAVAVVLILMIFLLQDEEDIAGKTTAPTQKVNNLPSDIDLNPRPVVLGQIGLCGIVDVPTTVMVDQKMEVPLIFTIVPLENVENFQVTPSQNSIDLQKYDGNTYAIRNPIAGTNAQISCTLRHQDGAIGKQVQDIVISFNAYNAN